LTEITVDDGNSFYSSLDGVLFDKSKTTLVKYPEDHSGSSYTITNSVTTIEDSAFAYSDNLTSVTIPNSITSIRPWAFYDCVGLTGIYFRGNAPTAGDNMFYYSDEVIVYRAADATGWPSVSEQWADRPTALWDSDGDGISDPWEERYFGGPTNANPTAICSNGYNTVFDAYIAGLNPTNSQSVFRTSFLRPPSSEKVLSWNSASGRVYSVHWTTNLMSGFQCLESNIPWIQTGYTNTSAAPRGFYQIKVRLP